MFLIEGVIRSCLLVCADPAVDISIADSGHML